MIERLIALIAPHYCINCQIMGSKLCTDCKNNISLEPLSRCIECQAFLYGGSCQVCQLPYQYIAACSRRQGLMQILVDDFKFHGARSAAKPLAEFLDNQLVFFPGQVAVTYVPTARPHVRKRGYDHARLLAKTLAKTRKLPCQPLLVRLRTARQVGSDRQTRLNQAKGLYVCRKQLNPDITYVLIDDVITTGATIKQASKALRVAGARKIAVLALVYQSGS